MAARAQTETENTISAMTERFCQSVTETMSLVGEEMTNLVSRRAQHTSETLADLATSNAQLPRMVELQVKWFCRAVQDYNEGTQRIVHIQGRAIQDLIAKNGHDLVALRRED